MHAHTHKPKRKADIFLLVHTNTHKQGRKTQTDRQTEHTHADNMRKKTSNSTNMKKSAETDRYDTAAAINTPVCVSEDLRQTHIQTV